MFTTWQDGHFYFLHVISCEMKYIAVLLTNPLYATSRVDGIGTYALELTAKEMSLILITQ
jgi:hypothetical protein